jgi:hypothetical protein
MKWCTSKSRDRAFTLSHAAADNPPSPWCRDRASTRSAYVHR